MYNSEVFGLIFDHIYAWAQAEIRGYYENLSKNNPGLGLRTSGP